MPPTTCKHHTPCVGLFYVVTAQVPPRVHIPGVHTYTHTYARQAPATHAVAQVFTWKQGAEVRVMVFLTTISCKLSPCTRHELTSTCVWSSTSTSTSTRPSPPLVDKSVGHYEVATDSIHTPPATAAKQPLLCKAPCRQDCTCRVCTTYIVLLDAAAVAPHRQQQHAMSNNTCNCPAGIPMWSWHQTSAMTVPWHMCICFWATGHALKLRVQLR